MVKEIRYISIKRVLDNLTEHPLLRDLTLEQVVRYTIRFIQITGYPKLYEDKIEDVEINDFRGLLPCDLISIVQVKDLRTGICLRAMSDTFTPGMTPPVRDKMHMEKPHKDLTNNIKAVAGLYIPSTVEHVEEPAFKTQGRVIYTSFPAGKVGIAYKAVPLDEDGFPMVIDNENFLSALELYVKKNVFTTKFDTGKIPAAVLQNTQREYGHAVATLQTEMTQLSLSEAEAVSRALISLIPRVRQFDNGFRNLGDREYIRRH